MRRLFGMAFKVKGFCQSSIFPLTAPQVSTEKRGRARTSEKENKDGNQSTKLLTSGDWV